MNYAPTRLITFHARPPRMWKFFFLYRSTQSFGSRVVLLQEHKSALPRVHQQDAERTRGWECVALSVVMVSWLMQPGSRCKMLNVFFIFQLTPPAWKIYF